MKRNVLLFISLCVVGCVMTYAQQMPGLLQKGKADTQDCKAWVDEQLSEMSLKEKIGQLFIHTVAPLQTQRNKNNIYAAIKEYKVGGLLFSGGQLSDQPLLDFHKPLLHNFLPVLAPPMQDSVRTHLPLSPYVPK